MAFFLFDKIYYQKFDPVLAIILILDGNSETGVPVSNNLNFFLWMIESAWKSVKRIWDIITLKKLVKKFWTNLEAFWMIWLFIQNTDPDPTFR